MTRRVRRRFLLAGLIALFAPVLAACAVNPVSGEKELSLVSPAEEGRIGRAEHSKMVAQFGGVYDVPSVGGYVAELGGRLVANSELAGRPFTFTVLNSPVVNAFALPGGYVYITRGLMALANDEAELAGVLAHEIGHVAARHTAQRFTRGTVVGLGAAVLGAALGVPGDLTRMGANLYLKSFSRDQEYEADLLGVRYLNRAGYDPFAQADFLGALGENDRLQAATAGKDGASRPPEFLSTHPRTPARVARAVEAALGAGASPAAPRRRDIYLDHIDGLIYGDDPAQGLVRGRVFSHPVLRFTYTVPKGFRLINSEKAVLARGPDGSAVILDSRKVARGSEPENYLVNTWARKVPLQDVERVTVNGMKAATGWARGRSGKGAVDVRLIAIQFEPERMFRFQFVTPRNLTHRLEEDLQRTTYSFRRLTRSEAAAVKPYRIRIVRVKMGDTASSLANRMAVARHKLLRFRVLNGLAEGENPQLGARVKIVTD